MMETRSDLSERLAASLGDQLRIERELGGGGMSRVFVALEPALNRRVVVKVLPDEIATVMSRERFRREILTSATLQHPNIVSVISAGDAGGLLYFIMPFVEGESLRGRLQREGPLSPASLVSVMRDVARALAFAHERGVVHRDIKPDNVLLSGGTAVVADFGVAKAFATARAGAHGEAATLTNVGMSLGTPAYMAPEQVAGDTQLDARTDLYALGAMAYEALCGRPVFPRDSVASILRAHLTDTPDPIRGVRPGIPIALEDAILRCLAKEPGHRPQSATELLHLLENPAVVSGAFSTDARDRPARSSSRRKVAIGAGAALVLAGVALGAWAWRQRAAEPAGIPVAAKAAIPTIAVLPLVSATADTSSNYLAFGVTDEIINALTRVAGIRVTSRSAAEESQRNRLALAQLAERLGATHALEGTIQQQGRAIHAAVRLVSTSDGITVWSEVFDGSADELFDMQRFIAQSVAEAVRKDLGDAAAIPAAGHQPVPEAHDAYLRAHYELARRGEGNLGTAIEQLQRAVAIDSQYAAAWAELAQAYTVLPLYGQGDPVSLQSDALRAAERALSIDSMLPAAHAAMGNLLNAQWRWREGATSLRKAVALDPGYAPAHQWLGENLLLNGDLAGAERSLAEAVRLDSALSIARAVHGVALALLRRPGAADTALGMALASAPSVAALRVLRGSALLYGNRTADAIRELETARVLDPSSPLVLGTLGYAYHRGGHVAAAREVERVLTGPARRPGATAALAKVKLGAGDTTAALDLLERAVRERDPLFASEPMASPVFSSVRRSERLARILQAAGLDANRLTSPACC